MGRTLYHDPLTGAEKIDSVTLNAMFSSLDSAMASAVVTGTAGENLSQRDFVYLKASDSQWYRTSTSATAPVKSSGLLGIVTESGGISSSGTGTILLRGQVSGFSTLLAWGPLWASTSLGNYTLVRPSVSDGGTQLAIVRMGVCTSTTSIYFNPGVVRYTKRATLANNGTLTIEHRSNPQTRARRVYAYIGGTPDEPLLCGSFAGSEEIGVRFDDGAGSDADTKTTFKNLTGSSADLTCIVEIL